MRKEYKYPQQELDNGAMRMESYYDTIPNFLYWDVEAWKDYLKKYVVPIYESTATLLELRDELSPYVGKSLKAVKDNDERLLPFFVGGIDNDGNYRERSLAKLIKLMFGIYVEPKEFSSAVRDAGETGFKVVRIKALNEKEASFLSFLKKLNSRSSGIINKISIEPKEYTNASELVDNPQRIPDVLKDLYKACVSFSANHNYYTFFIVSTASLHWKYLISVYPKLKEHFEEIKEFLGLEPIFVPEVSEEEIRKNYTIWGHEIGSLANYLYLMQRQIWDALPTGEIFRYITNDPEDLKREYKELANNALGYNWEYKEDLVVIDPEFDPRKEYWLKVSEMYIEKWPEVSIVINYLRALGDNLSYKYFRRTYERPYEDEMSKSKLLLTDFLNEIGLALFLGLARIRTPERELQEIEEKLRKSYYEDKVYQFKNNSSDYDLIYVGMNIEGAYRWL